MIIGSILTPMADERIRSCLEVGTSVFVGTIDANGMPACCRAIAVRSEDPFTTAIVYVPIATSRDTLANVAVTHRIAVVLAKPIEHAAIQLKGTSTTARLARDDERPFVRTCLEGLADVVERLGVPRRTVLGFAHWPTFAIEMQVEQIFEQTPGPKAGTRLR